MLYRDLFDLIFTKYIVKSFKHKENSTSYIRVISDGILGGHKLNLASVRYFFVKLTKLSVYSHKYDVAINLFLVILCYLGISCPLLILYRYPKYINLTISHPSLLVYVIVIILLIKLQGF